MMERLISDDPLTVGSSVSCGANQTHLARDASSQTRQENLLTAGLEVVFRC